MMSRGPIPHPPAENGWLKADFHIHSAEDPKDFLNYTAFDLLQKAHALGFHLLSFTLHGAVLENPALTEAAAKLGIRLIPGAEMRLEGADVVVLNITQAEAAELRKLSDLAALRQRRGKSALIVAPHPYFVLGGSIGHRLLEHIDLFDAVELCHFHTSWFDRNRPAVRVANRFNKPLVATSDAHDLSRFGQHYSLIEADAQAAPEAIFDAIRAGCVNPVSPHWSNSDFLRELLFILVTHEWNKWRAKKNASRAKRG